jgi:hypothetical protein
MRKGRILLELWQSRIHVVPRLGIRSPYIVTGTKPARIIQASSPDAYQMRRSIKFSQDWRTAVRAETPMNAATAITECIEIAR